MLIDFDEFDLNSKDALHTVPYRSMEIMPPDPVLGFVAITGYKPNPEPHWYEP